MDAVQTTTDWLRIMRSEFQEIPGLRLTKPQIQRLWGLDGQTCDQVVDALVGSRFLKCTPSGTYSLLDAGC